MLVHSMYRVIWPASFHDADTGYSGSSTESSLIPHGVRVSYGGTHGHYQRTVDGLTVRPAGLWFVTENFPRTQSENLAKSRLTDRPTVRRSGHGPWSVSMDRDFPYPASDTNYGRPARTVIQSTARGTHGHHPRTVDGLTVRFAGPWFVTENFPRTQSENLAKSRLTVRRSNHGPWSVSVDRDFPYPASDTNYGRPVRTVNRTTVRRSDRR
ncbi:hypothetical protein MTR67_026893 [Solanum verrucosum]|uniref:Uncharacterized protein n=1 Tax=Solanum verrucosum TaxID=315347 RepID=A0AAF0R2M9_SOLVR|nr:hypothetical protein MTR67_026893 [Solanum verrucosum]